MDRSELARRVGEACRLEGEFLLRSGQTASTYFDKYLFEGDSVLLAAVADHLTALVPEHVANLPTGFLSASPLYLCHSCDQAMSSVVDL